MTPAKTGSHFELPSHSLAERKAEVAAKLAKIRRFLQEEELDNVGLFQNSNIAWITAGADTWINQATDTTPVYVLVTENDAMVIADKIEVPRLKSELMLDQLGFKLVAQTWYASHEMFMTPDTAQDGPGAYRNVAGDIKAMRMTLMPSEIERMRAAGRIAADAMDAAARATRPGETEFEVAARLSAETWARGGQPIVNLIASDQRIYDYRHPLPTNKPVEQYVMLVLCARYMGLIASVTRLVHFGPLSAELRGKMQATARVDARLILGTRAGRSLGDMFELARRTYGDEGFPEAIEEHHQGGSAGYAPREIIAKPSEDAQAEANQAFAWNPSIRGVKSEDTVLLTETGVEVLTDIDGWPSLQVEVPEGRINRPAILEQ
jgi:antitoxin VapB